jgi:hypothetical protein
MGKGHLFKMQIMKICSFDEHILYNKLINIDKSLGMGLKLFMVLLGCKPAGRNTEQHDIFFSIGRSIDDLLPEVIKFWPEAKGKVHIDAWREVNQVDDYSIQVVEKGATERSAGKEEKALSLFFINLGGYRENEFDEAHYKMLVVDNDVEGAKAKAKKALFYKLTTLEDSDTHHNAMSHIDDKYGIDIDDMYEIQDILPEEIKHKYVIQISNTGLGRADGIHLGYLKINI